MNKIRMLALVLLVVWANESRAQSAATPTADPGKYATVYGEKIYYVEAGSGPVVVLLHGLGDDVSVWQAEMAPLSRYFRVIAVDQIGFGHSDKPLLEYRTGTFVDFLAGFLKALGIQRATLVGNSLGGWVAASFALAYPKRVERLVLVDAAGYASLAASLGKRGMSALRLGTREDLRYLAPLTFYDQTVLADDSSLDAAFSQRLAAGDGYTVGRLVEAIGRGDDALDGRLSAIKQPTLIVWGRADKLVPLSFARRFNKEITGSRLVVIEKCGHVPQIECPSDLIAALLRFLPPSN